jgi:hypothetical protein
MKGDSTTFNSRFLILLSHVPNIKATCAKNKQIIDFHLNEEHELYQNWKVNIEIKEKQFTMW